MKKLETDTTAEKAVCCILFAAPFCLGGFHVCISCVFSVCLLAASAVAARKQNGLRLYRSDPFLAVAALLFGLAAAVLWAVDRGMAAFGIFQFFPILPFTVLAMQIRAGEKDKMLECVPLSGAVMTVLSYALRFVPACRAFFSVQGRLAGFFQYPNTFAVFLLAGLVVCFWSGRSLRFRIPCACILLFGILASGSRTVFLLLIAALFAACIWRRDRQGWIMGGSALALGAVIVAVYVLGKGDLHAVGRFLTTSLSESTLLGRLLYYKDALPVILRHPFGLGYLGYYFMHHSFQTGVYSLMFVHSEPLQILLDVGWVPSLIFFIAVAENVFSKSNSPCRRMILAVLVAHSFVDFDFQFTAMLFLLLFCMDLQKGKEKLLRLPGKGTVPVLASAVLVIVYFGVAQGLQWLGADRAAVRLYPANTNARIALMSECDDIGLANEWAGQIIARNTYVAETYRVRAGYAYSTGDIAGFIENGYAALSLDPYDTEAFADYGEKLLAVIRRGRETGDMQLVRRCEQALGDMRVLMEATKDKTSALAWRIDDKPDFSLPKELTEYMQNIQGGQNDDD